MDITFCTFYFDIDRGNWENFTVPNNTYLYWFKNVLSLDIKLHIATEEKFVKEIRKARSKIDPNFEKTIIQVTTIQELEGFKKFNSSLEKLMFSNQFKEILWHPETPEMSKPLYNVLMFHKVNYLNEVAQRNPFNTDYFSWVDAGFIRGEKDIEGITSWPDPEKLKLAPDKIKFFCIDDNIEGSISSTRDHLLSQRRLLKGTIFFLHKNLTAIIRDKFNRYVTQSINNGYIGSDEKIFDLCCLNNPELFDLYKCNWREELKLFSYEYVKPVQEMYDVICEWESDEIEKSEDYDFWFFCVEDEYGKLIVRDDFSYGKHDAFLNFNETNKSLRIVSDRHPESFVIWPHSASKGYLKPLKKKVKFNSEQAEECRGDRADITIDEYFFVNLDRAKDRLLFIANEFGKSTILKSKIKKWTALDGRNINPDWIPSKIITKRAYDNITSGLPVQRGLSLTPGALGFYLTHIKIFEYAVSQNKNIFIIDDDVLVNENFDVEICEILKELPATFDFCYLGYYDTNYQKIPFSKKLFIPRGQLNGPHAYILSPKGAKKLLDLIFPMDIQLDSVLYTLQNHIEYYAAYERLAMYVDDFPSDIQHETGCVKNY